MSERHPVGAATRYGRLRGLRHGDTCVFRGVPFARAPLGPMRFAAPQPPAPWLGERDATEYGPSAPQNAGDVLSRLFRDHATGQSEDCLTLNLWTPAPDGARRPVLVWIHGGRFLHGSASESAFDGTALSRRGDVVVVAIQYRLGPLGYVYCNGDGPWPANLGVRDQIAALTWVRDEIVNFGGDPDNVTLFGHSAGSISVGALLAAPAARGLFHRAILQSGPPVALDPRDAMPVTRTLLESLGLRDAAALREVTPAALLAAEDACVAAPGERPLGLPYMPVVDGDVLPHEPFAAIADGSGSSVPLLLGTTRDEMTAYLLLDPTTQALGEEDLKRRCERLAGDGDAAAAAIEAYRRARAARGEAAEPRDLWFAMLADRYVRHPAMRLAEINSRREPRTFAYRFDWVSSFMEGALGACHSLEVPFVFGTLTEDAFAMFTGLSPEALELAGRMQDAWLGFARTGSPGGDWPAYDAARRSTCILGAECRVEHAPAEQERAFWDDLPA